MNWGAIGAIAELLGAAGVIASLVYLAAQIRQNTRSTQISSKQLVLSSAAIANSMIVQDKNIARLLRIGAQEPETLDEDERVQFDFLMFQFFDYQEQVFEQNRLTSLGENQRRTDLNLAALLSEPGISQWWQSRRTAYPPVFAEFVESQLSETPKARLFP